MSRQLAFGGSSFFGNHFGAVNGNDFVLIDGAARTDGLTGGGDVSKSDFSDFGNIAAGNSISADALVDNRVVVANDVVVHYGRVVEDLLTFPLADAAAMMVMMAEVFSGNKGVMAMAKSKVKANAYMGSAISEASGCRVMSAGGQRRPAAVVIRIAEGNPRGGPNSSRNPNPTVSSVQPPPSVMKWRPTP